PAAEESHLIVPSTTLHTLASSGVTIHLSRDLPSNSSSQPSFCSWAVSVFGAAPMPFFLPWAHEVHSTATKNRTNSFFIGCLPGGYYYATSERISETILRMSPPRFVKPHILYGHGLQFHRRLERPRPE